MTRCTTILIIVKSLSIHGHFTHSFCTTNDSHFTFVCSLLFCFRWRIHARIEHHKIANVFSSIKSEIFRVSENTQVVITSIFSVLTIIRLCGCHELEWSMPKSVNKIDIIKTPPSVLNCCTSLCWTHCEWC